MQDATTHATPGKAIQDGEASPLLRVHELLPTRVIDRPVPVWRVCVCGTSAGEAQLWYGYVDPVIFIFVRGALLGGGSV
jgi:hypothetical protein